MAVIRTITDLGRRRQDLRHQRLDAHLERAIEDSRRGSERNMSMTRTLEKMRMARGVVADVAEHLEAKADALIARGPVIKEKADETFAIHDHALDQSDSGLDELDEALRQMGNAPRTVSNGSGNTSVGEKKVASDEDKKVAT